MVFIGIDNGTTGSICIISESDIRLYYSNEYVFVDKDYHTSKDAEINRIDPYRLLHILKTIPSQSKIIIERPMINPMRFKNSIRAARCHEATLFALDYCGLDYTFLDSKKWTSHFFAPALKAEKAKLEAILYAEKEFPGLKPIKDADAIMIALYAKYQYEKELVNK